MRTPPRILPALITPFDGNGDVDAVAFRRNLRVLFDRGVHGFLIGGSTGEGPYLEPDERHMLVDLARDELGDGVFLLCGISGESTRMAMGQIAEAVVARADAVLVMTPTTLVRGRHDLVASHFREVADSSPLPVLLYTVPPVTGYELPVETVVDLATHPNVVGMKDSGGDTSRIPALRGPMDDGFVLYCGASRAVAESLHLGAYGAITASANYAFPLLERILATGDGQDDLTALTAIVERHGIAGTKAAAGAVGLEPGEVRRPLRPVADDDRAAIAAAVAAAGLP